MSSEVGRRRVLLVGMLDSVHVARWLSHNRGSALDVRLIASSPMRSIHPDLQKLLEVRHQNRGANRGMRLSISETARLLAIPLWLVDRGPVFSDRVRGLIIRREIRKFKPDLVHTMESQNGGYSTVRALERSNQNSRPKTLLTLFGSDLYWFSHNSYHRRKLQKLMAMTDFLQGECERDYVLAKELGFAGEFLPLVPVAGGLVGDALLPESLTSEVNSRRTIAIKGYGGEWGLGLQVLRALSGRKVDLTGYTIEVFSASRKVEKFVKKAFPGSSPAVHVYRKFGLRHEEMLNLFRRSKVYIGASKSDGLPASMLEAMSQGTFPIQTTTACTDGWFEDGMSGFAIEPDKISDIPNLLQRILEKEISLESAAIENLKTIRAKYSDRSISNQMSEIYARVLNRQ